MTFSTPDPSAGVLMVPAVTRQCRKSSVVPGGKAADILADYRAPQIYNLATRGIRRTYLLQFWTLPVGLGSRRNDVPTAAGALAKLIKRFQIVAFGCGVPRYAVLKISVK